MDLDQLQATASWLADIDPRIPFHIMGYIPVPGQTYDRPTNEQMMEAVEACRVHLRKVEMSHLSSEEALDLTSRDDRFAVRVIS